MQATTILENAMNSGLAFLGKSGRLYIRPPYGFGKGTSTEFRIFNNKEEYGTKVDYYDRCSYENMMDDLDTYEFKEFKLNVKNEISFLKTDEYGIIEGTNENILERIDSYYEEHGRDNVWFNHQTKTAIRQ